MMCDVQEFKVSSLNAMDSTIDHIDNLLTTVCHCINYCVLT